MKTNKNLKIPQQIKLAHEIIKNEPCLKLNEVSNLVNIQDRSNFRKYFRKRYGISPRRYKKLIIDKNRRKEIVKYAKNTMKERMSHRLMDIRIRIAKISNILYKIVYICIKKNTRHHGK